MLEKLKALLGGAKQVIIWIVAPVMFLLGFIYYLLMKKGSLQNQLERLKTESELKDVRRDVDDAKKEADNAETDYATLRDKYLSGKPDKPSE